MSEPWQVPCGSDMPTPVMQNKRRYFDYNATTPVHPEVRDVIVQAMCETPGNPSSIHQEGQCAKRLLETARSQVAQLLQAQPMEIYFTSGGTEANNLALFSVLQEPMDVVTTLGEHPSILSPLKLLAEQGKISLKFLPLSADGSVLWSDLARLITTKRALVSLMLVNNEIGTVYPMGDIAQHCREIEKKTGAQIHVHCDAIQAVGRLPVHPKSLGVDSLSFCGHKFYGPKGVGALWVGRDSWLKPRQMGGGQEAGIRAGTENLPGIVGLGKAAELARLNLQIWSQRIERLRNLLESTLTREVAGCRINGAASTRIFSTSNVHFPGVPGDLLHQALDLGGCAVSTGSACSSGSVAGSPVLKALGQSPKEASQAIRVSLGYDTTEDDVRALCQTIVNAVSQIRQVM